MNEANLIGRLGKDPESRTMAGGGQVVSLNLATSEKWTDKQTGERREATEWHSVVIFNEQIGKIAARYLRKGSQCRVRGRIQTRKWQDKSGNDRWSTEIVLQNFGGEIELLDGRQADQAGQNERDAHQPGTTGHEAHLDDDVPF